jgi:hypothetical protein
LILQELAKVRVPQETGMPVKDSDGNRLAKERKSSTKRRALAPNNRAWKMRTIPSKRRIVAKKSYEVTEVRQ